MGAVDWVRAGMGASTSALIATTTGKWPESTRENRLQYGLGIRPRSYIVCVALSPEIAPAR